jgi:hypothetical protein
VGSWSLKTLLSSTTSYTGTFTLIFELSKQYAVSLRISAVFKPIRAIHSDSLNRKRQLRLNQCTLSH